MIKPDGQDLRRQPIESCKGAIAKLLHRARLRALPVVEDPGDVLADNAGHGGKIILPDLLMDDDPARPDFLPEMIRQLEHRLSDAALDRKEATGCYHGVCIA